MISLKNDTVNFLQRKEERLKSKNREEWKIYFDLLVTWRNKLYYAKVILIAHAEKLINLFLQISKKTKETL